MVVSQSHLKTAINLSEKTSNTMAARMTVCSIFQNWNLGPGTIYLLEFTFKTAGKEDFCSLVFSVQKWFGHMTSIRAKYLSDLQNTMGLPQHESIHDTHSFMLVHPRLHCLRHRENSVVVVRWSLSSTGFHIMMRLVRETRVCPHLAGAGSYSDNPPRLPQQGRGNHVIHIQKELQILHEEESQPEEEVSALDWQLF